MRRPRRKHEAERCPALHRIFGLLRQPAAGGAAGVSARWGAAERDPFFRPGRLDCGRFAIPGFRRQHRGLIQPARGYNIDPKATYHDPTWCRRIPISPSMSGCASMFAPMRSSTSASTATSNGCRARRWRCRRSAFRRRRSGPLPHLYPFIVNDPGEGTQAKRRAQRVIVDHLTPPLDPRRAHGPLRELESADRRICAGRRRSTRSAPRAIVERRDVARPGAAARPRSRHRRADDAGDDALREARRVSLRPEGNADPRRAARARRGPGRRAARRSWSRWPACRAAEAAAARMHRCCARSPRSRPWRSTR